MGFKKWLGLILLFSCAAQADISQRKDVQAFINEMNTQYDFSTAELNQLFKQVTINQNIIELMNRPAERTKAWYEYEPLFVTNAQVIAGVKFWKDNEASLTKAEKEYGVPAEIIVAIIGVETRYGQNKGSFSVLNALSTLAFDYPKRSEFFRKELQQYLILTQEEGIDPTTLVGSYAGAMGIPQFMPSSYRNFAIDFTGNGKRDLWENDADAIGSVANYFKEHGWKTNEAVVYPASVTGNGYKTLKTNELEVNTPLSTLIAQGVKPDTTAKLNDKQLVTFLALELQKGHEYWIGLHNFYVITRYNRSVLYSMAVYELSNKVAQLKG